MVRFASYNAEKARTDERIADRRFPGGKAVMARRRGRSGGSRRAERESRRGGREGGSRRGGRGDDDQREGRRERGGGGRASSGGGSAMPIIIGVVVVVVIAGFALLSGGGGGDGNRAKPRRPRGGGSGGSSSASTSTSTPKPAAPKTGGDRIYELLIEAKKLGRQEGMAKCREAQAVSGSDAYAGDIYGMMSLVMGGPTPANVQEKKGYIEKAIAAYSAPGAKSCIYSKLPVRIEMLKRTLNSIERQAKHNQ